MVGFNFNMQGYVFQEGVTVLIAAYQSAADALHEGLQRAREEALAYQEGVDSGEVEWIGERDDEGHVLWDQEQVHEMDVDTKLEGQSALRKAFALAAYHHWERGARNWTGDDVRDHSRLVRAVGALGITVSPRLDAVRDLANLLKHDNGARGCDLLESWPAVFPAGFAPTGARVDWYGAVRLTDGHLDEVFNAVAASGPDHTTVYR